MGSTIPDKDQFIEKLKLHAKEDKSFTVDRVFNAFTSHHEIMTVADIADILFLLKEAYERNTDNKNDCTQLREKIIQYILAIENQIYEKEKARIRALEKEKLRLAKEKLQFAKEIFDILSPIIIDEQTQLFIQFLKTAKPEVLIFLLEEDNKDKVRNLITSLDLQEFNEVMLLMQHRFIESKDNTFLQYVAYIHATFDYHMKQVGK